MLIFVADIGNTAVKLALMEDDQCVSLRRVSTMPPPGLNVPAKVLETALAMEHDHVRASGVIVSSVVPELTQDVATVLGGTTGTKPVILTHKTRLPIENGYAVREQVGLDRLANAAGAAALAGIPVIAVDAGTAVTVDVVSEKGVFLGGAILPGAELWARALDEHTAALPLVDLKAPEHAIGTTTETNIQSGILFGLAGAIDRLVELSRQGLGAEVPALLTGGAAPLLNGLCRTITRTEPHLTLVGLARIYESNAE